MRRPLALLLLAALAGCGSTAGGNLGLRADGVECVPYARAHSNVQLYGDAADWWDAAAGRYDRTATPVPGGVLVFRRSARLPHGHVAVVERQVSPRAVTVEQANWVHGRISTGQTVLDVSPDNDWSAVRVWWPPSGQMGASTYSTYGFVVP